MNERSAGGVRGSAGRSASPAPLRFHPGFFRKKRRNESFSRTSKCLYRLHSSAGMEIDFQRLRHWLDGFKIIPGGFSVAKGRGGRQKPCFREGASRFGAPRPSSVRRRFCSTGWRIVFTDDPWRPSSPPGTSAVPGKARSTGQIDRLPPGGRCSPPAGGGGRPSSRSLSTNRRGG